MINFRYEKIITLSAVFLTAVSLAACSSAGKSSVVGTWGAPDDSGEPSLTLESDGRLFGTDGCNRMTGSYEADGAELTFGPIATTMMYCEGVDTWLSTANSASVSGATLTLFDQSGTQIGTLDRQ